MPTATVQVRQTTTTTTARSSVIVINTGYLSSKLGLLKFLIMVSDYLNSLYGHFK